MARLEFSIQNPGKLGRRAAIYAATICRILSNIISVPAFRSSVRAEVCIDFIQAPTSYPNNTRLLISIHTLLIRGCRPPLALLSFRRAMLLCHIIVVAVGCWILSIVC
jgi:hypothetical protein